MQRSLSRHAVLRLELVLMLGALTTACGPVSASVQVNPHHSPAANASATPTVCAGLPAGTRVFALTSASAGYTAREKITNPAIKALLNLVGVDNVAMGATDSVMGKVALAPDLSLQSVDIVADLRKLKSDSSLRDDRIRTQFLESNTYPLAHFTAANVTTVKGAYTQGDAVTFVAAGTLTVRDVARPFSFTVKGTLNGQVIAGSATSQLKMRDFGFDPPVIPGSIEVMEGLDLKVDFSAAEAACSPSRG